jgi:hypothetical protein
MTSHDNGGQAMTDGRRRTRPTRLATKGVAAALVILIAETIFAMGSEVGGVLGGLMLAWLAALLVCRPIVVRHRPGAIAAAAAGAFGLVLIDDPNALALVLFGIAISLAALLPRRRFGDALSWVRPLVWHGVVAVGLPWRDLAWAAAARRRRSHRTGARTGAAMLVVPIGGGALFLALFAAANPLIGTVFAGLVPEDVVTVIWRTMLALVVLTAVWATLRPRALATPVAWRDQRTPDTRFDLTVMTLVLSLATFNLVFALQNVLDVVFLWSDAPLPDGVTMADYAHRGAYALIVTALLAALFVLVTLRPGSAGAASPAVRRLVTLWIMQNLLLVASSALRLFDYIQAYSLTTLRIAALAWMALVATGLALILWRLLRKRSAGWLINANALAAALVLTAASVIDLGATAAAWNARTALRLGRAGPPLDLCYLGSLGPSGMVALATLERHARSPILKERLSYLRMRAQSGVVQTQQDWRSWSPRNARRLAQVDALVGTRAPTLRQNVRMERDCDGRPFAPAPLTKGPQR